MAPVTVERLLDTEGRVSYRVARVFPNAASAARATEVLGEVNPAGFEPVPPQVVPPELVVDEDGPLPGCVGGFCGMD